MPLSNYVSLNSKKHLVIHQVKTKEILTVTTLAHRLLPFYFSVYFLVLVSIEQIYQTLETVFHHISKHLEFRQKYSAARRTFQLSPRCLEM